jgi:Stage II sporulation protein E (SpoIIE)
MASAFYLWLMRRPKRWVHLDGVPLRQLSLYLLAVFFLFSVVGFYADVMSSGRQQYSFVFTSAIFSGLNAALWILFFARLANIWIVTLGIFQFFAARLNFDLARWVTSLALPASMKASVSVQFAATAILLAVFLSYICFVIYIRNTGRESYRLKTELALAHSIQKTLVPVISRTISSFDVFGVSEPSDKVGGDLVDLVELPSGDSVAYLADIAGHGLQAGILMGMLKTAVRTALMSEADSEGGILSMLMGHLNVVLPQVKEAQMYATFTGLRLNRDGQVFYGMAASPPLLHWRASSQTIDRIQEEQFPLGLLGGLTFSARKLEMGSGDLTLIATDGIYEVSTGGDVEFGIDALEDLLARHASQPLQEIASVILQAVHAYGKQLDDQTLLIVRKLPSA